MPMKRRERPEKEKKCWKKPGQNTMHSGARCFQGLQGKFTVPAGKSAFLNASMSISSIAGKSAGNSLKLLYRAAVFWKDYGIHTRNMNSWELTHGSRLRRYWINMLIYRRGQGSRAEGRRL